MKIFIQYASIAAALTLSAAVDLRAQPSACDLTEWMKQLPPHTQRTTELPPPNAPLPYLENGMIDFGGGNVKRISIPAGFSMNVYAKIPQCRGLSWSPDGVIYATSYKGTIYALPDHDHNGVPDSTIIVASGLNDPHGIEFYHGELYVSNNGALYHLPLSQGRIAISKDTVTALPRGGGHTSRNFVIDTATGQFYIQIGSNGNDDTTDFAHRAQVVEVNADGSGYRTYARGLRNSVGMDFDPRTGALWVNNNGLDDLFGQNTQGTANNPSECVYLLCDGANYGWPYCYGYQMRNPNSKWVSLDTNIIRTFSGPVAEVLAHSAPLGLHFYRGHAFPSLYHNAIFQCYHGSWDRTPPAPPRITVMWIDSDGRNGRVTDFVNGFQPDSSGSRWGRPVSIIEGADSALYVSDDAAGVIYRITWVGAPQQSVHEPVVNSPLSLQTISPNPVIDNLTLTISNTGLQAIRVELFDLLGKSVKIISDGVQSGNDILVRANLSEISPGTYIVRVTSGSQVLSKKIVVQH